MKSTTTLKATFLAAAASVSFAALNVQAVDYILSSGYDHIHTTTPVYDQVIVGQGMTHPFAAELILYFNGSQTGALASNYGYIGTLLDPGGIPLTDVPHGLVEVRDMARWENTEDIIVGRKGYGRLDIINGEVETKNLYIAQGSPIGCGAEVIVRENGYLTVGDDLYVGGPNAMGRLCVDGNPVGLHVSVGNNLTVGERGVGLVEITGGGHIEIVGDLILGDSALLSFELGAFKPGIHFFGSPVFGMNTPHIEVLNEGIVTPWTTYTIIHSNGGRGDLNYEDFGTDNVYSPFTEQEFLIGGDGHSTVTLTALPVPEPSTYALLGGVGAVALAVLRRSRKRKG